MRTAGSFVSFSSFPFFFFSFFLLLLLKRFENVVEDGEENV